MKITGGNADVCENNGVVKIATQNVQKTKELKIDRARDDVLMGGRNCSGRG